MSDRDLKPLPNVPLTLEEAAEAVFHLEYGTLRNQLQRLIAEGCPIVREGRRYLVYPAHVEAWRISRYPAEARRALRLGGYECSDASAKVSQ
jgi:hypothetical protein